MNECVYKIEKVEKGQMADYGREPNEEIFYPNIVQTVFDCLLFTLL